MEIVNIIKTGGNSLCEIKSTIYIVDIPECWVSLLYRVISYDLVGDYQSFRVTSGLRLYC